MDKFEKWVDRIGGLKAAKLLKVDPSMVSLLKNKRRAPSLSLALAIQKASRNAVTIEFWRQRRVRRETPTHPRRRA